MKTLVNLAQKSMLEKIVKLLWKGRRQRRRTGKKIVKLIWKDGKRQNWKRKKKKKKKGHQRTVERWLADYNGRRRRQRLKEQLCEGNNKR